MEPELPDTPAPPPSTLPLATPPAASGAAATLHSIEQKILSGGEPAKPDWESFQIGLLQMNMKIASDEKSSARVKADAVGKMLWATQMNLDRYHSEAKMREEYAQRDLLEENRMERRMDLEQAMKGHRWRTKNKKQWGNIAATPDRQTFAIPPYDMPYLKWPVKDGTPPLKDEEYDGDAVPRWVSEHELGRPVEADDLPDEVYWFGRRAERLGERKKEPLFRVVKFKTSTADDAGVIYRKTKRGKEEFPHLGETTSNRSFVLLGDDEISEYEAKAFGEQPPLKDR